jgi:hypothetical protein
VRADRVERAQSRQIERQQARVKPMERVENRFAQRQQNRVDRQQLRGERFVLNSNQGAVGFGLGNCPPGLADKGCMPPGQAKKADRMLAANAFRTSRLAALTAIPQGQFIEPFVVSQYVGQPVSALSQLAERAAPIGPVPLSGQ